MDTFYRHTFTYDNMGKLIRSYYKEQERDVIPKFRVTDEGVTSIKVQETVSCDGITRTAERDMDLEKLGEIIRNIFANAGREVVDVVNYAAAGTKVTDFGLTQIVKPEEAKRFVVITHERTNVCIK